MKRLSFGLLLLILSTSIAAQTTGLDATRPLKIGDTVPDILLENMINYPGGTAHLSDFRGKAIILDFWNKGCLACIKAFPKMQILQNKFDKELQVLLVTKDPKDEIIKLFRRSEIVKRTSLPMVTGNRYLHRLFPHLGEPYHVWLDKHHVVRHTSSGYNATPENLSMFLSGKKTQFADRHDNMSVKLSVDNSILDIENRLSMANIKYSSIISGKLDGYDKGEIAVLRDSISKRTIGLRCINMPIVSLYQIAFEFPHHDRVVLKVSDAERYKWPDDRNQLQKWKVKNTYCYELRILPEFEWESCLQIMQEDLNRYFKLHAGVKRGEVECFVLTKSNNTFVDQSERSEKSDRSELYEKTQDNYYIRNMPIGALLKSIRAEIGRTYQMPLVDETGIENRVSMVLPIKSFKTLETLRAELSKYGLDLLETTRELETMIIDD